MLARLSRLDHAWARLEGWLAFGVLLAVMLAGGFAAIAHCLSQLGIALAPPFNDLEWAESLACGGAFWLAFLGASLATYRQQHIVIDVLLRLAPPRAKLTLRSLASFAAGLISLGLAIGFWSAVSMNLRDFSAVQYELLAADGPIHVCDATPEQLAQVPGLERPVFACALRAALQALSLPSDAPEQAFGLIAPVMLAVIALRLLGQGVRDALIVRGGSESIARAYDEDAA